MAGALRGKDDYVEPAPFPQSAEPPAPDRVRVELDADARAPGQARRAVREVLVSWRLPGLVDSVVLAVSELVTNALRHGRPPVHVVLRRDARSVSLDVHDAGRTPPAGSTHRPPDDAESGRGLDIVQALAVDVGCISVPGEGKVVSASFPTADTSEPG